MTNEKINFYHEVEICSTVPNSQYQGRKGAVLGVSEENGVIYGYAVLIDGEKNTVYFDKNDLRPTGVQFRREKFY